MVSRFAAFVIWAAVAASIVFWALRLWVQPAAVPAHATLVSSASAFNGDLSRLFGTDAEPAAVAAAAPADPRFKLIGVVAPRAAADRDEGLALIALDDKPARAYRVGAVVDGETVLLSVHARGAALGPRGQDAKVTLELPALPPPATGVPAAKGGLPGLARAAPMLPPPQAPAAAPAEVAPSVEPPQDSAPRPDEVSPPERPIYVPPTSAGRERPL